VQPTLTHVCVGEKRRQHAQTDAMHERVLNDQFAAVVPWLMLNRGGLSILVHPNTDDPVADHEVNPLWLGEAVAIDVEFIRGVVKKKSLPSRVGEADAPHG